VLKKAYSLLEKTGITLDELCIRMGYESGAARRAV
jgi:hypothetical protein